MELKPARFITPNRGGPTTKPSRYHVTQNHKLSVLSSMDIYHGYNSIGFIKTLHLYPTNPNLQHLILS